MFFFFDLVVVQEEFEGLEESGMFGKLKVISEVELFELFLGLSISLVTLVGVASLIFKIENFHDRAFLPGLPWSLKGPRESGSPPRGNETASVVRVETDSSHINQICQPTGLLGPGQRNHDNSRQITL